MTEVDFYNYAYSQFKENDDVIEDIVDASIQQYVFKGRRMGLIGFSVNVKEKIKKIIYVSLSTTKVLLKYAVKLAIDIVVPSVAKELIEFGIDVIVELIEDYLNKDKFKELNEKKKKLMAHLSIEARENIELMFKKGKHIIKKQNKKLEKDINKTIQREKEKEQKRLLEECEKSD